MISHPELSIRWERCRKLLREMAPTASGLFVFSRMNIYYLTGTFGNGLVWLPLDGEPILLCRRGYDRARLESPVRKIFSYFSYKDVEGILTDAKSSPGKTAAVEMNGLSWLLGASFMKYLPNCEFISGDRIISLTRSKKTVWELEKMRKAR